MIMSENMNILFFITDHKYADHFIAEDYNI